MEGIIQFAQSANAALKQDYDGLMDRFTKFKIKHNVEIKAHKEKIEDLAK